MKQSLKFSSINETQDNLGSSNRNNNIDHSYSSNFRECKDILSDKSINSIAYCNSNTNFTFCNSSSPNRSRLSSINIGVKNNNNNLAETNNWSNCYNNNYYIHSYVSNNDFNSNFYNNNDINYNNNYNYNYLHDTSYNISINNAFNYNYNNTGNYYNAMPQPFTDSNIYATQIPNNQVNVNTNSYIYSNINNNFNTNIKESDDSYNHDKETNFISNDNSQYYPDNIKDSLIVNFDKTEIAITIASILKEIYNLNTSNLSNFDPLKLQEINNSVFFSQVTPAISLEDYLLRIIEYTKIDQSTLVLANMYIDIFTSKNNFAIFQNNIYR